MYPADKAIMPSKAGWDGTMLQMIASGPLTPIRAATKDDRMISASIIPKFCQDDRKQIHAVKSVEQSE